MKQPDPTDDDVQLHQSPVVRAVLWTLGTLSLMLGIIGVLVPVMPTTPFLLVAAACYARASLAFTSCWSATGYSDRSSLSGGAITPSLGAPSSWPLPR